MINVEFASIPPNTGLCDCNGTPNGLAEQDCFGTCNGTATTDNCGNCYGGNTGIDACVQDEGGVWGGSGAGANQCCGENIPAVTEPVCLDTDNGAVDPYGDDCAAYNDYPSWCGNYDDDDFISNEMCCICDGGTISEDIVSPEILALGPNGEQARLCRNMRWVVLLKMLSVYVMVYQRTNSWRFK